MELWKRLREALAERVRQRVTRLGLVFTLVILMVGLGAFASANNLLFLLLAAMLSALLVSGFISLLSLSGLELEFSLPEHVSARREVAGRILVRNVKSWMPSFSIRITGSPDTGFSSELYFPVIAGGATLEATVQLYFKRRGIHAQNSFHFETRFPFGFTERGVRVTLRRELLVYPCLNPQPGFEDLAASIAGEVETHFRGRGHDFYRIRPYEPMESARHVDWKATAHTGELQVREFAREQEHLIELFLDLEAPAGAEGWFERAVDCAAFLSWRMAARAARIRFRTQDFELCVPEEGDIYTILKYLALVAPRRAKAAPGPADESSYRVVLSLRPERFLDSGWTNARFLDREALPGDGATPPSPGGRSGGTGR